MSHLWHVRKSLKLCWSKQCTIFILTLKWWSNMVTCKLHTCVGQPSSNGPVRNFCYVKGSFLSWYVHPIFQQESTGIFDNDSVSINLLICVILSLIASSWSFSQPSPIMTCLTQSGKYFHFIHLFKITLTIILNSQQTYILHYWYILLLSLSSTGSWRFNNILSFVDFVQLLIWGSSFLSWFILLIIRYIS